MGWKYNNMKKTFYVDGGKNTTKIMHRKNVCYKYLTEWEPRSHMWVKIVEGIFSRLKIDGHILDNLKGYRYKINSSTLWNVKWHVDSCNYFFKLGSEIFPYGGFHSVRAASSKPLIIVGQDEA